MRTDPAKDKEDVQEALEQDKKAKERQKKYKDQKRYVWEHKIKLGDQVLLERKSTKANSPPYTVSQTHGTQITAKRGDESKTRDAQKWKKVKMVQKRDYDAIRRGQMNHNREEDYMDIGSPESEEPGGEQDHPPQTDNGARDHGQEEDARAEEQQGGALAAGAGGRARQPIGEEWSLRPPSTWTPPERRQPTTRAMSARRERDSRLYSNTK